tara:strand:- start:642 stop:1055 length:414 start_codon:yes stop_codon:yes gene_type:complete
MAATTEDQPITRSDANKGFAPVGAAKTLPHGTMCFADSSGNAVPEAGGNQFLGVVEPRADNSGGAAGDIDVEYNRTGQFQLTGAGFAAADLGKAVYATDNNTVSKTAADNSRVGTISEVISATQVMVDLDPQYSVPA